jgi:hypothetical protein
MTLVRQLELHPVARRPIARVLLIAAHTLLFTAISYVAFTSTRGRLFNGIDGAYMLTLAAHQFAFTPIAAGFFANPFQGLGDLWFNLNAWILPGYLVPHLLLGPGREFSSSFRILSYSIFALELFGSTLFFARSIGRDWVTGLLAAWSLPLLIMPYFLTEMIYPILELTPQGATAISETLLLLGLFARLGTRGGWMRNAAVASIILLLAMHYSLAYPTTTILAAPVLLFAGIGLVLGETQGRKVKLLTVGAVVALLAATGFAAFVLGIFIYSASAFWATKFEALRQSWLFGSILFQGSRHNHTGPGLFILGTGGLIMAARSNDRRLRSLAAAILVFVAAILLFAVANATVDLWSGPAPVYFEMMLWPIYVIFAAQLVVTVVSTGWRIVASGFDRLSAIDYGSWRWETLCFLLPLLVVTGVILHHRGPAVGPEMWPAPGADRPIARTLRQAIRMRPQQPYGGRVITLEALGRTDPVDWYNLLNLDWQRVHAIGNDYDTIGLWTNNIATLMEYDSTMSPAFFGLASGLLARPDDKQARSVIVLRRANVPILALLGVRYVIADADEPPPLRLLQKEDTTNREQLRLYEVPNVNLGTYSPTEIANVRSFAAALAWLDTPSRDLSQAAVMIGKKSQETDGLTLTSATHATIRLEEGGITVEATAPGDALLILPFEFSHCLTVHPRDRTLPPPQLVRIDAALTGLLFHGQVDANVVYFTGPFHGATCRIHDAEEFRHLVAGTSN